MAKASTKAQMKYQAKTYDRITVYVPKGDKERIRLHALMFHNDSLNGFIVKAITDKMENDLSAAEG